MDPMGTDKCFSICNVKAAPKTNETTLRLGRFNRSMFWGGSKWSNEAKTTSLYITISCYSRDCWRISGAPTNHWCDANPLARMHCLQGNNLRYRDPRSPTNRMSSWCWLATTPTKTSRCIPVSPCHQPSCSKEHHHVKDEVHSVSWDVAHALNSVENTWQLAIELILDDGDHDHDDIRFEVGRLREKTQLLNLLITMVAIQFHHNHHHHHQTAP